MDTKEAKPKRNAARTIWIAQVEAEAEGDVKATWASGERWDGKSYVRVVGLVERTRRG